MKLSTVRDKLSVLCNKFAFENLGKMNEAETRLSYIDPFWEALGWDIRDRNQVQVEKTDDFSRRPDYRFLNENKTLFFVEAKKPSEKLINPKHIYQTKLYCWNGNVPLAILTDFEEFRPFHSIGMPSIDEANRGILTQFDFTYDQYPDKADELLETFGRESVISGSLTNLLKTPPQIQRDSVDKAFLKSLIDWRKLLVDNIAKNNSFRSEFDLSEAVQRILDRIVFMRVLYDRDIEDKDQLKSILSKDNSFYDNFVEVCKSFAPKYNGLIFNSHPISEELEIEDRVFKPILEEFCFEKSPYRFDEIPVEMLGTIYEQFLGDEVSLGKNGTAIIERKPEVRKAGGVYYTPQYIVDYIVDNTVGKLLYGEQNDKSTGKKIAPDIPKTPADVAKLKILDPACGSGSFLLGAYDKIIKWHEEYFTKNPDKAFETFGKNRQLLAYLDGKETNSPVRLTVKMKAKILQNNIFGVDLDRQATEVAQMSLYIKCLEGLAKEPTARLSLSDAILPKLDGNIKCGNSLIGTDFISDDFFGLSDRERHKINPFDWEQEFPDILRKNNSSDGLSSAGFDAVIGNPPWGQKAVTFNKNEKNYFIKNYPYSVVGILDLFRFFIEKSIKLLNKGSYWGQVLPDIILLKNYDSTRKYILDNIKLQKIDHWGMAFKDVNLESCTLIGILLRIKDNNIDINIHQTNEIIHNTINQQIFNSNKGYKFNLYLNEKNSLLLSKLKNNYSFSDFFEPHEGIHSGNIRSKLFLDEKINSYCKKLIFGKDSFKRYYFGWDNKWVNYSKEVIDKNNGDYAGLGNSTYYETPKIVVRRTGDFILANVDYDNFYFSNNVFVCPVKKGVSVNLYFICGILNSKISTWYYRSVQPRKGKLFAELKINVLNTIPIPQSPPKALHDKLVELVERMLKLNKEKVAADDFTRKQLEQFIGRTDREIDEIVYKLYGLTEEEIKIVEGN